MNGDETLRVNLEKPIPTWILYGTAVVQEDGEVHFLKDIWPDRCRARGALASRAWYLTANGKHWARRGR